ncbi:MAG: hypothetical protein HYU64_03010 [Armatimonadetes bacterium]|nr:hypothetical protein [Armatimonadota bacterium]
MISTSIASISTLPSMLEASRRQSADHIAHSFSRSEANIWSAGDLSPHSSKDGLSPKDFVQPALGVLIGGGVGVCSGLANGALGGITGGFVGIGAGVALGLAGVGGLLIKLGEPPEDAYWLAAIVAVPLTIAGMVGGAVVGSSVSSPVATVALGLAGAFAGLLFSVSGDA